MDREDDKINQLCNSPHPNPLPEGEGTRVDNSQDYHCKTTGHEWDGITELDNPPPKMMMLVFYATIIFSIGYWILYPSWPTEDGSTKGTLGWTQHKQLKESQNEAAAAVKTILARFQRASFEEILADDELNKFALAGGNSAFKDRCAMCHGKGGKGIGSYPALDDKDWLWGGSLDNIYSAIRYGIRSKHDDTLDSEMPAFAEDDMLSKEEIEKLADYIADTSADSTDEVKELFEDNCNFCHGNDDRLDFGAPDLTDDIWLFGGIKAKLIKQISKPRHGKMPAWESIFSEDKIRQITIYVHFLGGGE